MVASSCVCQKACRKHQLKERLFQGMKEAVQLENWNNDKSIPEPVVFENQISKVNVTAIISSLKELKFPKKRFMY